MLKIEYMPVAELRAYKQNAKKHPKEQVEQIKRSIKEFGFNDPIAIWKKNEVIEGHGRLMASLELGMEEVPVIRLDNLTDEQRRAYGLVHNKLTMNSPFDLDMLSLELESIKTLDMSDFGFVLDDMEDFLGEEDEDSYYGDERERTFEAVNLRDVDLSRVAGRYDMPIIKAEKHIPDDLISFNYVLSTDAFQKGVHFYIDDYQFERIWNSPHEYMGRLAQFDCCLTPDFSLYLEMPVAMQIWNVYRSKLVGQIMQDYGIKTIPTLQWCRKDSFDFCFDGIEPGGVVSVSTIGVKQSEDSKQIWFDGMDEAIKRLKPSHVVVYGGDIGYPFKCPVSYISNHNTERLKSGR